MKRQFTFKLKDEFVRGMSRSQYKDTTHYLRYVAWRINNVINWVMFYEKSCDIMLLGRSEIFYEDLLK